MNVGISENKTFKYYFSWSMFFHISLVLLFLLIGKLFHDKINSTRDFNMKLIEASVKVDLVAMPKFTLKELKALPPVARGEDIEVVKKEIVPDKISKDDVVFEKKVKKVNFLDMMKSLSKKKVKKSKVKKVKKKRGQRNGLNIDSRTLDKLVAEGNKVSKGLALSGTGSSNTDMTEFNLYMSSLPVHIKTHWNIPRYLKVQNLKCRIRIYLKSNGALLKAEVFETSGVTEFDEKAMRAVKAAAPFPTVPNQNTSNALKGEIVLGFPL
ncbi:hypothetical protein A9Q84_08430 [Halobacteriovorax marinus]|uniref:TonB C-terminal domain-containing protein n=1 Tax=Halobacteriovorax marinus TaxID=97084 RepID=A0A1Y5FBY2_9BACT|nr:hypothetical protein A9Q84_08430 [Halobacteriovorax marinus]